MYPELRDVEQKLAAREIALAGYKDLLVECERQRRIDVDARHLLLSECAAYKGMYEQVVNGVRVTATDERNARDLCRP